MPRRLLAGAAPLLLGTALAAPPSVTLLSAPTPFTVTSSTVQAGAQLTVLDGGTFDVLLDPGRCGSTTYAVSVSRSNLNWPPGLTLLVRAEGLAPDAGCKTPPPALGPWATYSAVPAGASLNTLIVGGPVRATRRYRLDFTGLPNPLATAPGVYTTAVTYTITAP
ncbi:hypothetical protein [Deinococcus planocerae]|uniref:hypothetical protein n=1 Tax=Deinococcus planocerae TaxID=1737569 RepID=UPI0011AFC2BC|nr:hypothetical protein [Deinococcus planocerae]